MLFPEENLTRKMHILGIIAPRQIRRENIAYKMLKIEQCGEALHQKWNTLERRYASISNRSERFFQMLQEYENNLYI